MRRALLTLTIAGSLALAACGDDDDAAETTAAATRRDRRPTDDDHRGAGRRRRADDRDRRRTRPHDATAAAAGGYVPGADPDADAAALAWTTAFDSSVAYDAKAAVHRRRRGPAADDRRLHARPARRSAASRSCRPPSWSPATPRRSPTTSTFAGQPAYQDQTGTVAARRRHVAGQPRGVLRLHGRGPEPLPGR